jgi:hypothetical protein
MEWPDLTRACPIASAEGPRVVNRQALKREDREKRKEMFGTGLESSVMGLIVDSWVEVAPLEDTGARLVLQVAPLAHPEFLVITEAEVSLVADQLSLDDLSENLCHRGTVLAFGSWSFNGFFAATRLQLTR